MFLCGAVASVACGSEIFSAAGDAGMEGGPLSDAASVDGEVADGAPVDGDGNVAEGSTDLDASSHLIVFVTSVGYSDITTAASGDTKCNAEADQRLPGKFVAWLSQPGASAPSRLIDSHDNPVNGPWFRTDGVRVAASRDALLHADMGSLENPIDHTATGKVASPTTWTGTYADGGVGLLCPNTPPTTGAAAKSDAAWTAQQFFAGTCGSALSLYCFQVE